MTALSGGRRLEKHLEKLARSVREAAVLDVGFLEGATYPDEDSTPVALVAAVNNFGSAARGIPARPFFSDMIRDNAASWGPMTGAVLKAADYDARVALGRMGEHIKGELQQSIRDFEGEPLAPATVARKGFEKQLIDTSHMINSVDYSVHN